MNYADKQTRRKIKIKINSFINKYMQLKHYLKPDADETLNREDYDNLYQTITNMCLNLINNPQDRSEIQKLIDQSFDEVIDYVETDI